MMHLYKQCGQNIVLDVYAGSVFAVDDLTYDLLTALSGWLSIPAAPDDAILTALSGRYNETELHSAWAEIFTLQEEGMLFAKDDYASMAVTASVDSPVKAMCLHIAHDCNLRCKYCFAGEGDYGGAKRLMDIETAKRAIDFLIAHSGTRRNLEIDFFGGEPTLNFDVVKQTVAYARSLEEKRGKLFRFTLTTNGLLLNDAINDFINAEMSNIVLSLDGRKEVNDSRRIRVDGSGSYDAVLPKYQKLIANREKEALRGDEYYIRGTYTAHNLDFVNDILHLADVSFDQISIEPVVADKSADYAIKPEHLETIYAQYDLLAEEMIRRAGTDKQFNFFHYMLDLEQGPCAIKRLRGCGAGNEYIAVTPDGDVFPCHQFVGIDQYKMGSVHDGTVDESLKSFFAGLNIYTKEDCPDCWAKFYCSGGCAAASHVHCGHVRKPHEISCLLEKKRLECAIAVKIHLLDMNFD